MSYQTVWQVVQEAPLLCSVVRLVIRENPEGFVIVFGIVLLFVRRLPHNLHVVVHAAVLVNEVPDFCPDVVVLPQDVQAVCAPLPDRLDVVEVVGDYAEGFNGLFQRPHYGP